jgi:small subunit ribosomal protein S16
MSRVGRRHISCYRIVVADSRVKRDGAILEALGTYNPQKNPKEFKLAADRLAYWLKKGAQPSETVANLLKQDRFGQKLEGLNKGLSLENLNVERKAERVRKPKKKKEAGAKA